MLLFVFPRYPISLPYQEFVDAYKSLLKGGNNNSNSNSKTSGAAAPATKRYKLLFLFDCTSLQDRTLMCHKPSFLN